MNPPVVDSEKGAAFPAGARPSALFEPWLHADENARVSTERRISLARRIKNAVRSVKKRVPLVERLYDEIQDAQLDQLARRGAREGDEGLARRKFREAYGVEVNLDAPRGFAEKTQYLKLFDFGSLHTQCADKLAVRDYVRDRVGEQALIPLLMVADTPDELTPERLTSPRFVAKATHDSGSSQVCADRATFDWARCRRRLRRALARDFSRISGERQYRDVPRRVIVEEFVDAAAVRDYKFFCFHGAPYFCRVNIDRISNHRERYYTTDWRCLDVACKERPSERGEPAPKTLDVMLEYARALSQPFKFARIDLYEAEGRVLFSEVTFHDTGGYTKFKPDSFDLALGELLIL